MHSFVGLGRALRSCGLEACNIRDIVVRLACLWAGLPGSAIIMQDEKTDVRLAAQALAIFFLFWEFRKGKRVPSLLTLYWLLLLCVDVVLLRSFVLKDEVISISFSFMFWTHVVFAQHNIGEGYEFIVFMARVALVLASLIVSCLLETEDFERDEACKTRSDRGCVAS